MAVAIGFGILIAAAACGGDDDSSASHAKDGAVATDAGGHVADAATGNAGSRHDGGSHVVAMDAALDAAAHTSMDAAQHAAADAAGLPHDAGVDAMTASMMSDASDCMAPGPPKLVFLDKSGGSYSPGPDDARANVSSLLSFSVTHAAFTPSADLWTGFVDCVAQKFAPFNVVVIDQDPTTKEHVEVVVSGSPTVLPLATSIPDVAIQTCATESNAVVFLSGDFLASSPDIGCARAVGLVAVAYGLEHVSVCPDALSVPQTCPEAGFSDVDLTCGDTVAKPCMCSSGTTQNSFQRMLAVAGPHCQ